MSTSCGYVLSSKISAAVFSSLSRGCGPSLLGDEEDEAVEELVKVKVCADFFGGFGGGVRTLLAKVAEKGDGDGVGAGEGAGVAGVVDEAAGSAVDEADERTDDGDGAGVVDEAAGSVGEGDGAGDATDAAAVDVGESESPKVSFCFRLKLSGSSPSSSVSLLLFLLPPLLAAFTTAFFITPMTVSLSLLLVSLPPLLAVFTTAFFVTPVTEASPITAMWPISN
jgi:hypothetical protein